MSSFDRRALLVGGAYALASCGFTPLYGERSDGVARRIALQEAFDPETFAFRERMRAVPR